MKEDKRKLKDSMQEWLEVFKYPALQRTSYDRLEVTAVAQIYPKLGNKAINKITIEDIQNTINDVRVSGLSYSTARKTYLLLAEYFRYLEQNGIIEFNPVGCVEMMKKAHYMDAQGKEYRSSNETVTVFTAEEIERLRKEAFFIYKNGKQKHTQPDGTIKSLTVKQVADLLGHTTTEITELYYVKKDNTKLEGLTDAFNL